MTTSKTRREIVQAAVYAVALFWVNAYTCRDLFHAEFTGHTNSIQGLWISIARLAGEHWFRPSWWPWQDAGVPFEHLYMPFVPAFTAILSRLARVSASQAFNILTALIYCLGPVTLFLMAWRFTSAAGYAFWAALVYSLTSPARALIKDPFFSPAFFWTSRRLYTMTVWDDVPHGAAVCFLPLALLFLVLSMERRRVRYYLAAGLFIALTVFASVFGAVAIALSLLCLFFARSPRTLFEDLLLVGGIGLAAYLVVCPFLPPSLIAAIRANQQLFPEDQWTVGSFTALSIVVLGFAAMQWLLRRSEWPLRFFGLFAWVMSAIPVLDAYCNRHFLPQSGRYQPEMEFGIALFAVFVLRPLLLRTPVGVRVGLGLLVLSVGAEQLIAHRKYAKEITKPVDMTHSIERRVGVWFDQNMPGQRVMVPGSIAQWMNVFSNAPQLSGGSYSTTPNWNQQEAMSVVLGGSGPRETHAAVLWLKSFGVQAVTVAGPKSQEFWKPYRDPTRFEGILPVLWREDDVTIYRVPQRTTSPIHVIPAGSPARRAGRVMPWEELEKYTAALDDPQMPVPEVRWNGLRHASIQTIAQPGQVLSFQTNYHPGWHASANGRRAAIVRDGLGLMVIDPKCSGPCSVELDYDGGWEYSLCRLLSALTLLTVLAWSARRYYRLRRQNTSLAPT